MPKQQFQAAIEACNYALQQCKDCTHNACAHGELAEVTRLCADCADICATCEGILSRNSQFGAETAGVCADICDACAAECEKHPDLDYTRRCAEACRKCAEECRNIAAVAA